MSTKLEFMYENPLNTLRNVSESGDFYCHVCLKSTNETRLVYSKAYKMLRNHNVKDYDLKSGDKTPLLCYICNQKAQTSMHFLNAIFISRLAHSVIREIKRFSSRSEVVKYLKRNCTGAKSMREKLLDIDRFYAKYNSYVTTDILLVDSKKEKPQIYKEPIATVVIDDDDAEEEITNNNDNKNEKENSNLESQTLTHHSTNIEVDKATSQKDVTKETLELPDPYISCDSLNQSNQQFMLHPIINLDGVCHVPSLSSILVDGKLQAIADQPNIFKNPINKHPTIDNSTDLPKNPVIIHANSSVVNNMKVLVVHPMTVNSESSNQSDERNFVSNEDSPETKRQRSDMDTETMLESHEPIRESWVTLSDDEEDTEVRSSTNANSNSVRVDWEDQIPIDVISFIDEKGQSSAPMGMISDVRSVKDKPF